ncbi:MAG: TMEM43 family protein [Chloroflexota bacterium]
MRNRRGSVGRAGCGLFFGGILLVGALISLWINEGRTNMAKVAEASIRVAIEEIQTIENGSFIALQGRLEGVEPIGDAPLLKPGPYIEIQRDVEVYAWEEKSSSSDNSDNPSYIYEAEWTDEQEDSSKFNDPLGHENPPLAYLEKTIRTPRGRIGSIRVETAELSQLPLSPLPLTQTLLRADDVDLALKRKIEGNYLFIGSGSLNEPEIGDVRITYQVFESDQRVTLFGQLMDETIVPYIDRDDNRLYRAFVSGRDEAIQQMGQEYQFLLWGIRFGGLVMNWIGLMVLVAPLTSLLGRIPGLGRLGNRVIGLVALVFAFLWTTIVILVSIVAHNPILLVLFLLMGFGVGYWLWQQRKETLSQAV